MIDELRAILELLGDVTGIAGWVFGSWLVFKAVILLSTTGASVFLISLAVNKLHIYLEDCNKTKLEQAKINKQASITDVKIKGMCISSGTYESVVNTLIRVKSHVNSGEIGYLHNDGSDWLKDAVGMKMKQDMENKNEK